MRRPCARTNPIEFRRATGMRIATLGLQRQRTTQGIQAVQRIEPDQQHVGDGGAGNQVPVHHITKGFADPHTIEKHGQPCGVPSSGEAVKPR